MKPNPNDLLDDMYMNGYSSYCQKHRQFYSSRDGGNCSSCDEEERKNNDNTVSNEIND